MVGVGWMFQSSRNSEHSDAESVAPEPRSISEVPGSQPLELDSLRVHSATESLARDLNSPPVEEAVSPIQEEDWGLGGYIKPDDSIFEERYSHLSGEELWETYATLESELRSETRKRLDVLKRDGVYRLAAGERVETTQGEVGYRPPRSGAGTLRRLSIDPNRPGQWRVYQLDGSEHSDLYDLQAEFTWLHGHLRKSPQGLPPAPVLTKPTWTFENP